MTLWCIHIIYFWLHFPFTCSRSPPTTTTVLVPLPPLAPWLFPKSLLLSSKTLHLVFSMIQQNELWPVLARSLSLLGTGFLSGRAPISPIPFCISGCLCTYILSHSLTPGSPKPEATVPDTPRGWLYQVGWIYWVGRLYHIASMHISVACFLFQRTVWNTGVESSLPSEKSFFCCSVPFLRHPHPDVWSPQC